MNKLSKSIVLSLFCNLFHYYSFSIYAFSAVILSPIFFSTTETELTKIFGLITLSLILLLKPLGNIIFGHIGDKYGRKVALIYSLVAINVATTCIGLIPSYASIGWLSSVCLMICLFVQGTCMGGQYTGAIIFIQEHTKKHNAAFFCGLMVGIGILGTLLGTTTSFLFYDSQELGWTWRLPFLLTSIMGIILCYLTKYMEETPLFVKNKNLNQSEKAPFMDMIKNHRKPLYASIFISSIPISMFYLATIYLPNFYGDKNNVNSASNSLRLICMAQVLCMVFVPLFGYVADRIGKKNQLKITSVLLIITPLFLFYFMEYFNNSYMLIVGIATLSVFTGLYTGAAPAYLSEHFPVIGRYSGMGVSISIGEGLFGGLSPIICLMLEKTLDSKIAPAYFIMFLGIISFSGILLLRNQTLSDFQADQSELLEVNGAI
ncbi:MAG: MFS transporter [Alphaproteobacteria bacterium]|nr:MFS transporter [Alphaproteobacteria bacterium]